MLVPQLSLVTILSGCEINNFAGQSAKSEICEDRYQTRSTILTSQLPVSRWHEQIGDPTIADGILHRLVHNAHRIEMRGESMRKKRNPPQDEKKE